MEEFKPTEGFTPPMGYEDLELETEIPEEKKYTPGMDDPDQGQAKRRSRFTPKFFGVVALLVILFLVVLYFAFNQLNKSFSPTQDVKTITTRTSDDEYLKLLEQLEDKDKRLATLEADKEQMDYLLEKKVGALLASYKQAPQDLTPLWGAIEELKNRPVEVVNNEQVAPPPYPETPPLGSASASGAYNAIADRNARLAQEQKRQELLASQPPLVASMDGLLVGSSVSGKLLTGLVSSPMLNTLRAVVVTEVEQVVDGIRIPAGTRFIGSPVEDLSGTRRIYLPIDQMVMNGRVIQVKALATRGGNPGLVSKYVDPNLQAAYSSILPNLLSGAASVLQSRTTTTDWQGNLHSNVLPTPKNAALGGVANSLSSVGSAIRASGSNKRPLVIVHAGMPLQVLFQENLAEALLSMPY